MKKIKFDLIQSIRDYFAIQAFEPIMPWIEHNINLSDDVSSQRDKPDFTQYPYQVDIIKNWEDIDKRKHVVVMASEQLRKINNVGVWITI